MNSVWLNGGLLALIIVSGWGFMAYLGISSWRKERQDKKNGVIDHAPKRVLTWEEKQQQDNWPENRAHEW